MSKLRKWGKVLLFLLIVAAVVYWLRFSPMPVTSHRVTTGEITAEVMGTGTLEAKVQTVVSSKIAGRIAQILADQGDMVKEGQVLLRLDDSELKQQVEIARSTLAAANASVERVKSESVRVKAVLDQTLRDHQRNQRLFASRSISDTEIDKSQRALAVAEADQASSNAAVLEAQKNVIAAQNTLDYHLARLRDTVIKSPFDGLIVRRDRDTGDVVVPGSSIFLLISTEGMWIRAWVDETEMAKVGLGQPARVVFRSEAERSYAGKVVRLARETDRETRQFIVDVEVNHLPTKWAVGQRAEVFIQAAQRNDVLVLPSRLLLMNKEEMGVFVHDQGRAAWRSLKLGLRGRERVEVLEGLRTGEAVITVGDSKRLYPGRRVKIAP
jgi:HlyD family secretion protein